MKRFALYLIILLTCSACHDELKLPTENLRRVVVVYMMAENSLSNYSFSDLYEIRSAAGQIPDSCAMVVYVDNSRTDQKPQIIELTNEGEKVLLQYKVDQISTDSTVMKSILSYITKKVSADEYGLILWSHGSGWIPAKHTIGIDNNRNIYTNVGKQMEISELKWALEQTGVKWNYILFDACFMQCAEVAYELKDLTHWCIGSPAEIPLNGAPYDKLMTPFFDKEDYAHTIAEQYYQAYKDNDGVLISAVQTGQLDNLANATARYLSNVPDFPTNGIQRYCAYASETGWKPEYYDIGSCMGQWLSAQDYNAWSAVLDAAVPYRYSTDTWKTSYTGVYNAELSDADHYAGLSIYLPASGRDVYNASWRQSKWYAATGYVFDNK